METTIKTTNKTMFFLQGLLFSAVGLILIIFPHTIPQILSIIIAVALFLMAISAIWVYVKDRKADTPKNEWYFIVGAILAVGLGIWLLADPQLLIKLLAILAGVWLLLRSIQLIGTAITMKSFGTMDWLWFILVGLVVAIFAIIFLSAPTASGTTAIILAGIAFLLIGIYYFVLLSGPSTKKTTIKIE